MRKKIGEHIIEIPEWKEGMELLNEGLPYEESYWRPIKFPTQVGSQGKLWDFHKLFLDTKEYTQQYAYSTTYDNDGKLISISREDSATLQKFIIQDIHRRQHGVHMKNGDDIEWIAPDYYFFIQWFQQKDIPADKFGSRLGSFRKIQNNIIQLWEHVKCNDEIAGLIVPKIKKCGITYLFCGAFLNEATLTRNNDFLMMSKDYETCKLSLFTFIKYAYDALPFLLKPFASKMNESEIAFSKPADKKNENKIGKYLKNLLKATKTKTAAFDGPVPFRCWLDEFPKIWEASKVSVKETFDKSIEAIKVNQRIRGKLLMTSYMPENFNKGFDEARTICEKSLLRTIKEDNVRTESNMIILPIYAHQSNDQCFDKYGDCNEKEALRIVMKDRSAKKTPADIQTHKRQYPLDWKEMFDNAGAGSVFPNLRLNILLNELHENDIMGIRPYKEGNLRWKIATYEEGVRPKGSFCEVYFEELTPYEISIGKVGSIRIFTDLEEIAGLKHLLNRPFLQDIRKGQLLAPHPDTLGVISVDPVDYALASDVRQGSLNGSYGGFVYDQNIDSIAQDKITNLPLYEYNFRHENPDRIMEDMIKATLYWGFYAIIEGNKKWLYTEFKQHGLQNFLMVKQADGSITPWKSGAEKKGGNNMISTDKEMINVYCRAINNYFAEPKSKDFTDWLALQKSIPLAKQLIDFDPMDTRRFDLGVSFGYWRVGIENFIIWLMNRHKTETSINPLKMTDLKAMLS